MTFQHICDLQWFEWWIPAVVARVLADESDVDKGRYSAISEPTIDTANGQMAEPPRGPKRVNALRPETGGPGPWREG